MMSKKVKVPSNLPSPDITERKRVEEALRKAHHKLEMRVKERTAQLAKANEELRIEIAVRKLAQHDLKERIKQLQCLYGMANIADRPGITLNEVYQEVTNLLPSSWQYPEITCARVTFGDKEFKTDNFKTSGWKQSANINVKGQKEGTVEVYYLEERPEIDEGPFSKEERLFIDAVAEQLGKITERKRAGEALRSFTKLAVDRELRMIELKKEINIILQKLGEEPRYKIVEENKTKLNK